MEVTLTSNSITIKEQSYSTTLMGENLSRVEYAQGVTPYAGQVVVNILDLDGTIVGIIPLGTPIDSQRTWTNDIAGWQRAVDDISVIIGQPNCCPPLILPAPPTTVNGTEITGQTVKVTQGGVEVGTVNPATGGVVVDECPECDPLTITVGRAELTQVDGPCGQTVAISVLDRNGTNVDNITLNGLDIIIDDLPPICASAAWTLKDQAGNTIQIGAIASGGAADIEAPDAKVQLKDSAGNNIGSANSYLSGSENNLTAPDGTVLRDGAPYGSVKSNGVIDVPSNCPVGDPIIYAFGRELWSGQTSSYVAGDEGDLHLSGWFDDIQTIGSNSVRQYLVDHETLGELNYFGNTQRWTALDGSAYATSGDRMVIDHFHKLQLFIPSNPLQTGVSWTAWMADVATQSHDGHTDWVVPPLKIWLAMARYQGSNVLLHGPFQMSAFTQWSSTTASNASGSALSLINAGGAVSAAAKTATTNRYGIVVRKWTP